MILIVSDVMILDILIFFYDITNEKISLIHVLSDECFHKESVIEMRNRDGKMMKIRQQFAQITFHMPYTVSS